MDELKQQSYNQSASVLFQCEDSPPVLIGNLETQKGPWSEAENIHEFLSAQGPSHTMTGEDLQPRCMEEDRKEVDYHIHARQKMEMGRSYSHLSLPSNSLIENLRETEKRLD